MSQPSKQQTTTMLLMGSSSASAAEPSDVAVSVSSTSAYDQCKPVDPSPPSYPCKRYMEEVWQEINLSSLLDHPRQPSSLCPGPDPYITDAATFRFGVPAVSLQDFLAQPFHEDSRNPNSRSSSRTRLPQPTSIGLSSGLGRDNYHIESPVSSNTGADAAHNVSQFHSSISATPSFDIASVGSFHYPFMCKETAMLGSENDNALAEQRQKRLMKNRESAARSRARKQSYMSKLEKELDRLQAENATLRRQYLELKLAGRVLVPPQKQSLRRTLTAPF